MPSKKAFNLNPNKWDDPDNVGTSEYRYLHELASDIWESNKMESVADRKEYIRASFREMKSTIDWILETHK